MDKEVGVWHGCWDVRWDVCVSHRSARVWGPAVLTILPSCWCPRLERLGMTSWLSARPGPALAVAGMWRSEPADVRFVAFQVNKISNKIVNGLSTLLSRCGQGQGDFWFLNFLFAFYCLPPSCPSTLFLNKGLFIWEAKWQSAREKVPSSGSLRKWPQQRRLDQVRVRSLEIHPGLPDGWSDTKSIGSSLAQESQQAGDSAEWCSLRWNWHSDISNDSITTPRFLNYIYLLWFLLV